MVAFSYSESLSSATAEPQAQMAVAVRLVKSYEIFPKLARVTHPESLSLYWLSPINAEAAQGALWLADSGSVPWKKPSTCTQPQLQAVHNRLLPQRRSKSFSDGSSLTPLRPSRHPEPDAQSDMVCQGIFSQYRRTVVPIPDLIQKQHRCLHHMYVITFQHSGLARRSLDHCKLG